MNNESAKENSRNIKNKSTSSSIKKRRGVVVIYRAVSDPRSMHQFGLLHLYYG